MRNLHKIGINNKYDWSNIPIITDKMKNFNYFTYEIDKTTRIIEELYKLYEAYYI